MGPFLAQGENQRLLWPGSIITLPRPMKAQRRHELKANSLIWTLQGLPQTIKKYQSQIALALILIALIIVMVNYRIRVAQERLIDAQRSLSAAGEELQRMQESHFNPFSQNISGSDYMKIVQEYYFDGLQHAEDALDKTSDSQSAMKAEALLDKGDLNFQLANMPDLPGAATQPALRPSETTENLLNNAYDAYMQILQSYPNEKVPVISAHFGLAAVAENRAAASKDASQWDAAKTQYQAIIDSDAAQPYKVMATFRLNLLPRLSKPVMTGFIATSQPAPLVRQGSAAPSTRK
jgi:hypothetical protein